MENHQEFDAGPLDRAGLIRHAIFNLTDLPAEITAPLELDTEASRFRQLILIGHAGKRLWDAVKESGVASEHPIDDFTIATVRSWFADCYPRNAYDIVYPGPRLIGLQRLGQLAGWHHPAPFMVGIDRHWGTWFAYRAVVLADTRFVPTRAVESAHPCSSCSTRICIASCPAGALADGRFNLDRCLGYRKQEDSACRASCVARVSCPVGAAHRYTDEQMRHSYSLSMRAIELYY